MSGGQKDLGSDLYFRALAENTRALIRDRWPDSRVALEQIAGTWKCMVEGPAESITEIIRSFGPTPGRTMTKLSPAAIVFTWSNR